MRFPVYRLIPLLILTFSAITPGTFGQPARQLRTVVIDAGHGGNDPGAVAGGVQEKDLVLSVALRLANKIKNGYPDVKVIFTRSKDVFIPLYERASKAIRNKADVFISIHANCVKESVVRGTETFLLGLHRSQENLDVAKKENSVILLEDNYTANYQGFNPNEPESYIMFENMQSEYQSQSIELAANIQNAFTRNIGLNDRGVKQAGFLVLRETSMPSVLIEIGFISNPGERKFLMSETGKEKISESIFQAFSDYKKRIDQKSRFDLTTAEQSSAPSGTLAAEGKKTDTVQNTHAADSYPVTQMHEGSPEAGISSDVKDSLAEPQEQTASAGTMPPPANDTGKTIKTRTEIQKPFSEVSRETARTSPAPKIAEVYYSVQIGAFNQPLDPSPENFKGEKNVFRVKVTSWFKYYSGKFSTPGEASGEKSRLNQKFPDAFITVFENEIPRYFRNR